MDWGLGHATRCVPLIRQLMKDNSLILGITPGTAPVLKAEFPDLKTVAIEPYNIRYSKSLPLLLKLLSDAPRIAAVIKKEQEQLNIMVQEHGIDLVISDNRLGLYHEKVESIYMTHQLRIKAGMWSAVANRIHRRYMQTFDKVWVPDFEDREQALAGELSENPGLDHVQYIGPLSRLNPETKKSSSIDYLVLLSGVEPQRSMLEEALCLAFRHTKKKVVFVRGSKTAPPMSLPENISVVTFADAAQLSQLIADAETIICRSGYSSLMDLYHFQKKQMVLVPTPGQSEQEYLAQHWKDRFGASVLTQAAVKNW
ncbi:MAG: glycosyltransferase, partial [Bacteroidia bacterium]|nr:glycosyltransferase [Bacteroidia bacterium]